MSTTAPKNAPCNPDNPAIPQLAQESPDHPSISSEHLFDDNYDYITKIENGVETVQIVANVASEAVRAFKYVRYLALMDPEAADRLTEDLIPGEPSMTKQTWIDERHHHLFPELKAIHFSQRVLRAFICLRIYEENEEIWDWDLSQYFFPHHLTGILRPQDLIFDWPQDECEVSRALNDEDGGPRKFFNSSDHKWIRDFHFTQLEMGGWIEQLGQCRDLRQVTVRVKPYHIPIAYLPYTTDLEFEVIYHLDLEDAPHDSGTTGQILSDLWDHFQNIYQPSHKTFHQAFTHYDIPYLEDIEEILDKMRMRQISTAR
ncbi:hypothetical protein I317_07982 [Kwoniella heveanensis CBS 569]|nr:hypothetical protein I317_07982 [Kwoniella heveanensis CBS 569]